MSDTPLHQLTVVTPDLAALEVVTRARRVLDGLLDEVRRDLAPRAGRAAVTMKSDGTPVTVHDRETDDRLVGALLAAFPGHGAVSEEREHVAPGTDWTWVLDPIDGTSNFIAGLPYWCVSVALCLEGAPVLGVVEAPALARRFSAVAGHGAWVSDSGSGPGDEERLAVAPSVDLHDRTMSHVPGMYSGGAARDLYADRVQLNARVMGASALDLAMVAAGTAPVSVALGPHVWDVAAGTLLVIEAGGAVVGHGDRPLLPLEPGRDYADTVVRTAAASDVALASAALAAVDRGRATRRQA
jgi:myo-inositol-1(or 4)-monophosphatase